jgi:hypothetical protein
MRTVTDDERRARIAVRHGLGPGQAFAGIPEATCGMTAWHATDPPSVHLAIQARTRAVSVADIDRALNDERSLIKQLSMRRTLFAVDRHLLPAVIAGPGRRTAGPERRRLVKDIRATGRGPDPEKWLATAESAILACLGQAALTTAQVREVVPEIAGTIPVAIGTKWGQDVPPAPRVLTVLAAEGAVTRGPNATHWRVSKPSWTTMGHWLGEVPDLPAVDAAYAELVRNWLWTFGPGTEEDIVWWFGATKTAIRAALADIGAVRVALESGQPAWLHPGDVEPVSDPGPWVALLPTLDPTTMGWRGRDFYLDARDRRFFFDSVGNGQATVWADGRIIGAWAQSDDGAVRVVLRGKESRARLERIDAAVSALEDFLDGEKVPSTYARALLAGEALP